MSRRGKVVGCIMGLALIPLMGQVGPCGEPQECWDVNRNGIADPEEDQNGDGFINALDCLGDIPSGVPGYDCWDANLNRVDDPEEDRNGDGVFDTRDCLGDDGPPGPQGDKGDPGEAGPQGLEGDKGEPGEGGGDITAVNAGSGLSGGGTTGSVTLSVGTGAITSSHIASNTITGADIASAAVDEAELATGAVTMSKISAAGASDDQVIMFDGFEIGWATPSGGGDITAVLTPPGSGLNGGVEDGDAELSIADGGVSTAHLGDAVVISAKLADEAVTTAKLAHDSVTSSEVVDGAVTTDKISTAGANDTGDVLTYNGAAVIWQAPPGGPTDCTDCDDRFVNEGQTDAVETSMIRDAAVTNAKLASNSVDSSKVLNNSLTDSDLDAGAVGSAELQDDAVTNTKLRDNSVDSSKIANGSILTEDISSSGASSYRDAIIWDTDGVVKWGRPSADVALPFYGEWGGTAGDQAAFKITNVSDGRVFWGEKTAGTGDTAFFRNYGQGRALFAYAANNYAGYFSGNVHVTGSLTAGDKQFRIDHPANPDNKYLAHSSVESDEMINVYSGLVVLDKLGSAPVELPDWLGALNHDFRYQLTPIGAPMPNLYVAEEINGSRFKIAGGKPGGKVSWQVTGVRHDPWAEANPLIVEEEKAPEDRGHYLHPELYGQPPSAAIGGDLRMPPQSTDPASRHQR